MSACGKEGSLFYRSTIKTGWILNASSIFYRFTSGIHTRLLDNSRSLQYKDVQQFYITTTTTTKTLSSSYQTPFFIPSVCSNPNWRRSLCIWLFYSYLIATILIARSSRLSPPSPTTGWKATFPSLDVYLSGYIYIEVLTRSNFDFLMR